MIGLDTNVLVRYIVQDDKKQAELARILIEEKCDSANPAHISLIVLCEIVWILNGPYKATKTQIIEVLQNILLTETFDIELHDTAWIALKDFTETNADYADCIIARLNQEKGCSTTYTFDKKAAKLPCSQLFE